MLTTKFYQVHTIILNLNIIPSITCISVIIFLFYFYATCHVSLLYNCGCRYNTFSTWKKCYLFIPTKTCPEQAKFESYLSQRQAGIQVFSSPALYYKKHHVHEASSRSHRSHIMHTNTCSKSLCMCEIFSISVDWL